MDAEFSAKARVQMMTDGTTALVAVLHEGKVYVGNGTPSTAHCYVIRVNVSCHYIMPPAVFLSIAGDSRAVLIKKGGKVKPMSEDHRPDRYDSDLHSDYEWIVNFNPTHSLRAYTGRMRSCASASWAGRWCTGAGGAWRVSSQYPGMLAAAHASLRP